MNTTGCKHHLIAQGVVARVEYCADCGICHVSMDSITVRFRPTALRDLRDTLNAALQQFADAGAAEPARKTGERLLQ